MKNRDLKWNRRTKWSISVPDELKQRHPGTPRRAEAAHEAVDAQERARTWVPTEGFTNAPLLCATLRTVFRETYLLIFRSEWCQPHLLSISHNQILITGSDIGVNNNKVIQDFPTIHNCFGIYVGAMWNTAHTMQQRELRRPCVPCVCVYWHVKTLCIATVSIYLGSSEARYCAPIRERDEYS